VPCTGFRGRFYIGENSAKPFRTFAVLKTAMQEGLSKTGAEGDGPGALRKRLDEAVVLQATVAQLRKDLREEALELPEVGEGAFEELRTQVLAVIQDA
jgi:hypothetical protein